MTPEDEVQFLRAANEVEFRCDRIEHLQLHKPEVDAGTELNPLIIFDVGTLPKQIAEFMQILKRLSEKYPDDARPSSRL